MSFAGLHVLSLESRRAKEMETLIARHDGVPIVAPSVKERALEDQGEAFQFLERLESGEFELLICMTGVGLTFLKDVLAARVPVERLSRALQGVEIIARGPKPVGILRSLGVTVQTIIPEPSTWKEIVAMIAGRRERRIAIQEYGRPNAQMNAALENLGAAVTSVALYRWEMPEDREPLREAARRLAAGKVDVVLFTSSIQLEHLLETASELGLEQRVRRALASEVAIASVGAVMTATLTSSGFPPAIIPQHPKMASLVKAAAEQSGAVLARMRQVQAAR